MEERTLQIKWNWKRFLIASVGTGVGAILGGVLSVIIADVLLFVVYPAVGHFQVDWDSPGLGLVPLLAAPFGILIGAVIGAVVGAKIGKAATQ